MITHLELISLQTRKDFAGFGYLGHHKRTGKTDHNLLAAANKMDLTLEELYLWANSKFGRHFMDYYGSKSPVSIFVANMRPALADLRREVLTSKEEVV